MVLLMLQFSNFFLLVPINPPWSTYNPIVSRAIIPEMNTLPFLLQLQRSKMIFLTLCCLARGLIISSTPTVIEIPYFRTIKYFLLQALIDFIMHMTCPTRRRRSRRYLRRVHFEDLLEVSCAIATWV